MAQREVLAAMGEGGPSMRREVLAAREVGPAHGTQGMPARRTSVLFRPWELGAGEVDSRGVAQSVLQKGHEVREDSQVQSYWLGTRGKGGMERLAWADAAC